MDQPVNISISDLVFSLANIIDKTNMPLHDHHRRTAIAAYHISNIMGISQNQQEALVFAAAIHDIGAFSFEEQQSLSNMDFEYKNMERHAKAGYIILNEFDYFHEIANIIRYHHTYLNFEPEKHRQGSIPLESYIIQVADTIALQTNVAGNVLDHYPKIIKNVKDLSGKIYAPEVVAAFLETASFESFWLDIDVLSLRTIIEEKMKMGSLRINLVTLTELSNVFRRIIDFRSKFTSTHSAGVSAVAASIAQIFGYPEDTVKKFVIAGYLHDIGKLVVPTEILEKPGALTVEEFNVMRSHTYFTNFFLDGIELFSDIRKWACEHHEKLDGAGYPFHIKEEELTLESRIMAIADVFTALTERRPYRDGMSVEQALNIMNRAVNEKKLDRNIYNLLAENVVAINEARITAEQSADEEYSVFLSQLL